MRTNLKLFARETPALSAEALASWFEFLSPEVDI